MSLIIVIAASLLFLRLTVVVYERFWDRGLAAEVTFDRQQIEEGQGVVLREKIENNKILPLPALTVKFKLERGIRYTEKENTSVTDKQYRNDCIFVMPYQRVTRSFRAVGTSRGFYSVDEVNLVAEDVLFRKILARDWENHTWLYVYPRRSKLVDLPAIFRRLYGECLTNRLLMEDPFEFKGIRDYTRTDPMRRVNWKASAKTGVLKVNQYYDNSSQRLTIFLNVSQSGILKWDDLMEESIRIVRNFVEDFVQKGIMVRFLCNGGDLLTGQEISISEGAGLTHIDFCLKQLARLDIHRTTRDMAQLIRTQSIVDKEDAGELSLLISAEQSEELAEAYRAYAAERGSATWLIPIHASMKRYLLKHVGEAHLKGGGNGIHVEYLVMEEQEGSD